MSGKDIFNAIALASVDFPLLEGPMMQIRGPSASKDNGMFINGFSLLLVFSYGAAHGFISNSANNLGMELLDDHGYANTFAR
ncbi:hypothetical protein N4G40_17145 [Pantoea eucrina]|uniref:Uncharacterized protein n=1 Tax=Pantoea eucrina TaxID=472693 RepID=A0ABU5LJ77_9GAMM|nr:hypothetical protein [Pantoea eucrina]MDZ7279980.1 hypothetical protein [Pantoea eucrina]